MRVLADHGVLGVDQGRKMAQAAGFGNVLVHDCIEVDDDVMLVRLADLSDLEAFAAALAGLTGQP